MKSCEHIEETKEDLEAEKWELVADKCLYDKEGIDERISADQ